MLPASRRDFLKCAAGLAVGSALTIPGWQSQSVAGTRENKGKIFKSNKGGFIGSDEAGTVQTLEEYKRLGFDGIEGESPGLNVAALNAAKGKVDFPVHGLVDSIHWKQRLSSPDPAIREAGLQGLLKAIHDSKAVGGTTVLLVPGKVTGPDETHDDVWKRSIIEIRKAIPVAESQGIKILIENVWNGFCETPEQMRDYVDEINSPWVGVYFDIGNVRKFGKPEEWIALLGPRIGKLDVKDWGVKNGFCRLGEGDVDWPAVRAALKQIQYTGWATREGKDKSLADTAELMNELLDL
ncbi:TIM barrel protein [Planctomicrobium piriforme]|uniref:Hexulose-6-phosphate isomerase n=1 Tax=Planctomicrobium piriforme TaxID=1576369 RepID=A0A1I3SPD4_9PLAN|nr:TIM barrel protein [Planctomicrobium piriforme]SFJ60042.1 hexulose-6-phosphate isomerase [Planctomicrobium piriforme]